MAGKLQDLNYLHLYYFWTVAGAGSITAACALLHVTQPTISMQIRRLEQAMRAKLFERVGRGLRLTEVGRVVFDYAEDIFSLGQALVDTVKRIAAAKGVTPAQLALAWVLAQKPWIAPIPGTTKLHRLEENIGAEAVELTAEDLAEIEAATADIAIQGERYSGMNLSRIDR